MLLAVIDKLVSQSGGSIQWDVLEIGEKLFSFQSIYSMFFLFPQLLLQVEQSGCCLLSSWSSS